MQKSFVKKLPKALILSNFTTQHATPIPFGSEIENNKMLPYLASFRLQLKPAIQALDGLGLASYSASPLQPLDSSGHLEGVKLIIIGKITVNSEKIEICHSVIRQYLLAAKNLNIPVVTMYSNHHLSHEGSIWNRPYRDIISHSKKIICPSKALSESLARLGDWSVETVEDTCIDSQYGYKKINPDSTINILWYGNVMNLNPLLKKLPYLLRLKSNRCFSLDILTGRLTATKELQINQAKEHMSSSWEVTCQQWTYEKHLAKLRKAHFTLLPCEQDEHKKYAGHNRLLDAISGGTVPIASPIPSYKDLKEVAVLSDHLVGSFVESLKSYNDISKNFEKRREKILSTYTFDLTVSKYQNLFSSLID